MFAGLAAYAAYKYFQLSDEEKKEMTDKWKAKGRKIFDDYAPDSVKSWFEKDEINGAASSTEAPAYSF